MCLSPELPLLFFCSLECLSFYSFKKKDEEKLPLCRKHGLFRCYVWDFKTASYFITLVTLKLIKYYLHFTVRKFEI